MLEFRLSIVMHPSVSRSSTESLQNPSLACVRLRLASAITVSDPVQRSRFLEPGADAQGEPNREGLVSTAVTIQSRNISQHTFLALGAGTVTAVRRKDELHVGFAAPVFIRSLPTVPGCPYDQNIPVTAVRRSRRSCVPLGWLSLVWPFPSSAFKCAALSIWLGQFTSWSIIGFGR